MQAALLALLLAAPSVPVVLTQAEGQPRSAPKGDPAGLKMARDGSWLYGYLRMDRDAGREFYILDTGTETHRIPLDKVAVVSFPWDLSGSAAAAAPGGPASLAVAVEPGWREVTRLSGRGAQRGAVFPLSGRSARIVYRLRADSELGFEALNVYLVPEGQRLLAEGGVPEVTADRSGGGSTRLVAPVGRYYLEAHGANADWVVSVQEVAQ